MQNTNGNTLSLLARLAAGMAASAAILMAAGCGAGSLGSAAPEAMTGSALQGHVFGGQQPVSGAAVQLYAASQIGYGVASTALISAPVQTDANGNFNITGTYTCPYSTSQVYITATGGNSGSGTNANLALMAPLGPCGNLTSSTFIMINELTTVAGAYALAPFMSSPTQLSTTPTNTTGLSNAFLTVNKLINTGNGQMPGSALPTGATVPTTLINTLGDIIASCVNTNGVGGSSNNCNTLFANATSSSGTVPTDTLTAALNIAKSPGSNTAALFGLAAPTSPFQPTTMSAPAAFTMSIRYAPTGIFSAPSASAVDASGNLWVTNAGNNSVAILRAANPTPLVLTNGRLNNPSAIAFDSSGDAWVTSQGSSSLSVFTIAGTGTLALSANLSAPTGVAIDGQGLIWVTNSGTNSVTAVTTSGISVTGSTNYSTGGTTPIAVAINPH